MLAPEERELEALTGLGLTLCQARIYLALVHLGTSTVKTVSGVSKVTREDVYRILPQLHKLGLVEKKVTSPIAFKAVSMQDGLSILMQRRIEETDMLRRKTKELLRTLKKNRVETAGRQEEPQFILIPERESMAKKRKNAINSAQKSIEVVTSWNRCLSILSDYNEEHKKALNRGVEIRVITEKPEVKNLSAFAREILQSFEEYATFKIRYSSVPITSILTVFDRKEVCVITSPALKVEMSPALWSNHPSLVELAQTHFDTAWAKLLEDKGEKLMRRALKAFAATGAGELSPKDLSWTELSKADYQKIWTVDSVDYSRSASANHQYPMLLLRLKVAKKTHAVHRTRISFVGHGTAPCGGGVTMKVWNHIASSWQDTANSLGEDKETVSLTLASNITNYINSDGFLWVLARTKNPSDGSNPAVINCDYVSCSVNINGITYLLASAGQT